MSEEQIRRMIVEELQKAFRSHIFLMDGVDINTGGTNGTRIGNNANAKLAFYDATPVARQNTIALTGDATINAIITAIKNVGIIK